MALDDLKLVLCYIYFVTSMLILSTAPWVQDLVFYPAQKRTSATVVCWRYTAPKRCEEVLDSAYVLHSFVKSASSRILIAT